MIINRFRIQRVFFVRVSRDLFISQLLNAFRENPDEFSPCIIEYMYVYKYTHALPVEMRRRKQRQFKLTLTKITLLQCICATLIYKCNSPGCFNTIDVYLTCIGDRIRASVYINVSGWVAVENGRIK